MYLYTCILIHRLLLDDRVLRRRVGPEAVDGDDDAHAVLLDVLDVRDEVRAALPDQLGVLRRVLLNKTYIQIYTHIHTYTHSYIHTCVHVYIYIYIERER